MKTKFTQLLYIFLVLFFTRCTLDDVTIDDNGEITEAFLVQDKTSAKSVLNNVYSSFRSNEIVRFSGALMVSGTEQTSVGNTLAIDGFYENKIPFSTVTINDAIYTKLYYAINTSNYLITQVKAGKMGKQVTEIEKNTILAEAKTLRAFARFMLLRAFGQFYNINSAYGIVISNQPVVAENRLARGSVKESYQAIIEDLEFGIKNNATYNKFDTQGNPITNDIDRFYVTKTTAKALLAKVYLYKKEYKKAEKLAKEVISVNTGYGLEAKYEDIFTKKWKSTEVLFAPITNKEEQYTGTELYGDRVLQPSGVFRELADKQVNAIQGNPLSNLVGYDPRFVFSYKRPRLEANAQNFKYPFFSFEQGNTIYFLRMAEVYLIYAEAYIRNTENSIYTEAVNAINTIRNRANVGIEPLTLHIPPISETLTKSELLQKVREEKMLELFLETGETWFDLIRYINNNNLTFNVKQTLTKKEQFTFPIPIRAIRGNTKLVQNPGY